MTFEDWLAVAAILLCLLLSFFFAWTDFVFVVMLTFNQASTLPFLVTTLTDADDFAADAALSVVLLVVALAMMALLLLLADRLGRGIGLGGRRRLHE